VADFLKNFFLKSEYNIIAYYQKKNSKIVAAIQHQNYPIVGVQFHPEKILYEHKSQVNIVLSKSSMIAA
jgi:anthranilate/para-aminobenzoate synthase component II